MKVTTNEQGVIQLEEVFSGIILKTKDGEEMSICMRDSGFEFNYQGERYFAKEGFVMQFMKSIRGNLLVDQQHEEEDSVAPGPGYSFPEYLKNIDINKSE
jgi:hypothetical protein